MPFARERAAAIGQEAQRILTAGSYLTPDGTSVDLTTALMEAKTGTRSYPPEASLPTAFHSAYATTITVANETTLAAAHRLVTQGYHVAALNFASARYSGGGWLSGARAQEESLARASGLVACIANDPMYARHEHMSDALYTSSAIYSPDVPVFRDDEGHLLAAPYRVSFITAPAVNAGVVLQRDSSRRKEITATMRERVGRVLTIAAVHNHDTLVLGAWGCGVFKNDPTKIAALFAEAIAGPFKGVFGTVAFAVLDTSAERRFMRPFESAFPV